MKYIYNFLYLGALAFLIILFLFWGEDLVDFVSKNNALSLLLVSAIAVFSIIKPKISFFLFIFLVPFEIITLHFNQIPFNFKLYQIFAVFLLFSVFLNLILKNKDIKFPKLQLADFFVTFFGFSGFLTFLFMGDGLRGEIIMLSYFIIYILTRFFIQNKKDLEIFLKVFIFGVITVSLYTLVQNYLSIHGIYSNLAMNERPNATFLEPDWLGMYLAVSLSVFYVLIYFLLGYSNYKNQKFLNYFIYFLLFLVFGALIITVARSAWLSAFFVTILFLLAVFVKFNFKKGLKVSVIIVSIILSSYFCVKVFHFTNFSLKNRVASTALGKQVITVSCSESINAKEISDISQLKVLGCAHINLEDIEKEKLNGKYVTTLTRPDPNVNIRLKIYKKSLEAIKKNWVLGYGWESSKNFLGVDGNGTPLNTSNIFLEIWLSGGVLAVVFFVGFLLSIILKNLREFLFSKSRLSQAVYLFSMLCVCGIIISNMFNAGQFLAFLWVLFGTVVSLQAVKFNKE